jgi:hypothetical protein
MRFNRLFTFAPFVVLMFGLTLFKGSICNYPKVNYVIVKHPSPSKLSQKVLLKDTNFYTIMGVGDIMLGTNFPPPGYLPPADHENLLLSASDILHKGDLVFGNLEGTILNEGGTQKKCRDSNVCYLFRMPDRLAPYLKNAGFDVVSMANNHSGDFGPEGRNNTLRVLDSLKIGVCGLLVKPYSIIRKHNLNYGIIAFSPNSGTLDINNIDSAKFWVSELRTKCDILIVSFHGGGEGRGRQHIVQGCEMFCGEKRGDVCSFAHAVIDAGADVVFGQGPHVPRAMELYKNKIIAYSLGNFCTYARFSLSGENSYAPLLSVTVDKNGNFIKGRIYSYTQKGEGGPVPDANEMAYKRIKLLTQEDMPETPLLFRHGGIIEKRIKTVSALK